MALPSSQATPGPGPGLDPTRLSLAAPSLAGNLVEGSFGVARVQKAPGGYTVYQILFKVDIVVYTVTLFFKTFFSRATALFAPR